MPDPISLSLVFRTLLIWGPTFILRCLNHGRSVASLRSTIEQTAEVGNSDPPTQYTERVRERTEEARVALQRYSDVGCSECCCVPYYQYLLEEEEKSLYHFMETAKLVLQMRIDLEKLRLDSGSLQTNHSQGIEIADVELDQQTSTVRLEGQRALMEELRRELVRDEGDQVFNLTGFAGTGKTTFAKLLCRDLHLRLRFNDNIVLETVGLEIESNKQKADQFVEMLRGIGDKRVLLVLDDVQGASSQQLVERCLNQISSDSKILLISRVALTGIGRPWSMKPLSNEEDAKALFNHFVRPIGTTSTPYEIPDHIFLQVVRGCGGFPLALKLIATELRGKPIENWQQLLNKWLQQNNNVLDSSSKLLNHLQDSLIVLEDNMSLKELFMDLPLFPKMQSIPVTALIDMWIELYNQDEHGIDAMTFIHHLTSMNLADMVVERKVGIDADNYYNYHFLRQHDILRDLAIRLLRKQGTFENRRRLIISGNDSPEASPPQQPQAGFNACLSSISHKCLMGSKLQRVAARILSISTDQQVTSGRCNIEAKEAEVLVLNLQTEKFRLPKFMKKMRNLKVFILTHYGLRPCELENLKLLTSLWSLKRIRLEKISVPLLCKLNNLRKISFCKCIVTPAFHSSPIGISQAMPKLVELDIDNCQDLVKLPDGLCDITTLKKLSISNCHLFIELPKEIGNLENLELLRVSYCLDFKVMPESMARLGRLSFLDISYCEGLTEVQLEFGSLRNLTKLYVMGSSVREFPDSVTTMEHLNDVMCDEFQYDYWNGIRRYFLPELVIKGV